MTKMENVNSQVDLIRVDKLYESLRYNEYSPENGMGEIVDNSVEAGATRVDVKITRSKKPGKGKGKIQVDEIAVIDNGCGMGLETLSKCLALGESIRPKSKGKLGIGKFGVGMTLGSISLARRVEVYSRANATDNFLFTYIDLELIGNKEQICIPYPIQQEPDDEYKKLLKESRGTIVVLKNCDRINGDIEGLANYLGRTYRKFIERGLKIFIGTKMSDEKAFRDEPVYLHDPLFLAGPTKFDIENRAANKPMDPKAKDWGIITIPKEIPDKDGETADVTIRITLLPEEWRQFEGAGGSPEAKKRHIPENEGISILRADREVLYGHVPFILGAKGAAKAEHIDRFWGCEISFPPELDAYFQVRYIKRGAEPIESLKAQIRTEIMQYIPSARKVIRETFSKKQAEEDRVADIYSKAETAMANISHNLPLGVSAKEMTESEEDETLDLVAKESLDTKREDSVEQKKAEQDKKAELRKKPFSVEPVSYPKGFLFDTVNTPNALIIKLNVNHPFYIQIMKPLCGNSLEEGTWETSVANKKIWDAMLMLLFAYAKAETMFGKENALLFEQLRTQWGAILGTAIEDVYKGGDGA